MTGAHLDFKRDPDDPEHWQVWCSGSWRPVTDVAYVDVRDEMRKKLAYRVCSSCGADVSNRFASGAWPSE